MGYASPGLSATRGPRRPFLCSQMLPFWTSNASTVPEIGLEICQSIRIRPARRWRCDEGVDGWGGPNASMAVRPTCLPPLEAVKCRRSRRPHNGWCVLEGNSTTSRIYFARLRWQEECDACFRDTCARQWPPTSARNGLLFFSCDGYERAAWTGSNASSCSQNLRAKLSVTSDCVYFLDKPRISGLSAVKRRLRIATGV